MAWHQLDVGRDDLRPHLRGVDAVVHLAWLFQPERRPDVTWQANAVLAGVLAVALPILGVLSWRLTALRLGDARATALGINTSRLRIIVLVVVSLVAATTVAFAGIIGFIGLVGPHIARMLVGEDQRYFVPASMAAGAAVMCAAHALSLVIKPGVAIPIGIVTSLLGVPFFIAIVMTRRRALWT